MQLPVTPPIAAAPYILPGVTKHSKIAKASQSSDGEEGESPPWKMKPHRTYERVSGGHSAFLEEIQEPSTSAPVIPQTRPSKGVKRRKRLSPDADILYEQLKFIKRCWKRDHPYGIP
ncbi:unnamed protein product [Callosobruchus maculatus]|uniref:Uncharacterized protein n=1 Tax=Callosobruchus maculatus TaxID=64391 RepID=A0A653BKD3_CALMS|nr:unnamed protein product [Callosobruchus maculatus]